MKNITNIILGLLLVVLISATTANIMTVKPSKPRYTQVKYFTDEYDAENVAYYIEIKIKRGWILKEVEATNDSQTRSTWVVVMEKY
jgi:hypothetical protein